MAADNQQKLKNYITSLQKLLRNFALYHFHCQLTIDVCGTYLGQTHIWLQLKKTRTDGTTSRELTFQSIVATKECLKQAILELAQPLLAMLPPCDRCQLKHYKKNCMCPFLLMGQ